MNKANESFSAFLDGEATELDIQRMLKAMEDAPESVQAWHELSKTQACLQDDVVVDSALSYVQLPDTHQLPAKTSWQTRIFQGGIAAAVAVVFVTAVNVNLVSNEGNAPVVVQVDQAPDNSALAQQQFEAQQRLDLFLKEHAEQASFTTGHAVVPSDLEWVEASE